jgi:hypothetical protein
MRLNSCVGPEHVDLTSAPGSELDEPVRHGTKRGPSRHSSSLLSGKREVRRWIERGFRSHIECGPGYTLLASATPSSSFTGICLRPQPTDLQEPDESRGSRPVP